MSTFKDNSMIKIKDYSELNPFVWASVFYVQKVTFSDGFNQEKKIIKFIWWHVSAQTPHFPRKPQKTSGVNISKPRFFFFWCDQAIIF